MNWMKKQLFGNSEQFERKGKERLEEDFIYIIWMLLFLKISPETLTTLTILIAQSPPEDREKMIGMILLLLNKR